MRTVWHLIAVAGLAFGAPLAAQDSGPGLEPVELDAAGMSAVNRAGGRGQSLFWYDRAAWFTTDAMREDIADPSAAGINGWVVIREEEGLRVTYWKADGESYAGVYSALFNGSSVAQRRVLEGEDTVLSGEQVSMIEAQNAVITDGLYRCTDQPFNSVILPPEQEGGPVLFYLLTPQTTNQSVPAGGHFLFEVQDGEVTSKRNFTNSCLELQTVAPEEDATPKMLMTSHLLDPYPTEIHVFVMLAAQIPLVVMTTQNRWMWTISQENGRPQIYLAGAMRQGD